MRYLSMLVIGFILVPSIALAGERLTPRPIDPVAAKAFERALARSATLRSLVATLESSNVIVHIESSWTLPLGIGGTTRFVTSSGGYRYVRISISASLPPQERGIVLGHELQHACEVAESSADSVASLRQLFGKIGHQIGEFYETAAAQRIEHDVREELRAVPTRTAVPARSAVPGK